nr:energy transducer TonB [Microvirga puerhi]
MTERTAVEQEPGSAELVEALSVQELPIADSEAVVTISPSTAVRAQPPEESKPQSKPLKLPPPKKVERKPPSPQSERRKARPSDPRQGQVATSRENLQGAAAAADPDVLNRYIATLAATLRDRLRYPEIARSQGISGVATLRFTMHRSGQVIGASLLRSTGSPVLDEAALAVARPGGNLPPAPDSLPQQQFSLSVPLRFNLR